MLAVCSETGLPKLEKAYQAVQDEVQVIVHGMRASLDAYADLDEPDMARDALQRLVMEAHAAGLSATIGKARLLPAKPGLPPPETTLEQFKGGMTLISTTILSADPFVSIDLQPRELCLG